MDLIESDDEEAQMPREPTVSLEEQARLKEAADECRIAGGNLFSTGDYAGALKQYTLAVEILKQGGMKDAVM